MQTLASDIVWAIAICGLIAASPFLLDRVFTRRRLQFLEREAGRLGFSFQRRADPFAGSNVRGLLSLQEDPAALTINVMRGRVGACETLVFELAQFSPTSPAPIETTFAGFRCPSGQLPVMQIGERGWAHRLADAVEGNFDLNLGSGGGGKLFVHCADERVARQFLPPDKLARLRLEGEHFRIESSPDWLLIFRPGKRVKPEALAHFVSCTSAIASALLEQPKPHSVQTSS